MLPYTEKLFSNRRLALMSPKDNKKTKINIILMIIVSKVIEFDVELGFFHIIFPCFEGIKIYAI